MSPDKSWRLRDPCLAVPHVDGDSGGVELNPVEIYI
jgi:hypothetical protein